MATKLETQKKLFKLFEESESVAMMPDAMKEKLQSDLMGLTQSQMESLAALFLQEKNRILKLKDKIRSLNAQLDDLLLKLKMAGKGFDKTLIKYQERKSQAAEEEKGEQLLSQLDKI